MNGDRAGRESSNPDLDAIVDQGSEAARAVADELRLALLALAQAGLPWPAFVGPAHDAITRYEPLLARTLSDALLAAWLTGAREVASAAGGAATDLTPPTLPPLGGPISPEDPAEPLVSFPLLESGAADLAGRQVLTAEDFYVLDQDAKRAAFTVARISSLDTLEKLQEALARDVREGGTLADFRQAVEAALDESALSPAHVENVYRTNVATAYTRGLVEVLASPLVGDEFPYMEWVAVHDARAREDHRAMEEAGLDGTGVYRLDDPAFAEVLPPADYNCRCHVIPLSIEDAARKGVAEARKWLETGMAPLSPARVGKVPLVPSPGWRRTRLVGVI